MNPNLPLPIDPTFFTWHGHQLASYRAGSGPPILLVHSINAAASSFEMRKPFAGLQDDFHVMAFDLLGFGRSERPPRRYSAEDYIDQIVTALQEFDQPAAIMANTLGAAYAIAAARRASDRVRALILVCPTGIEVLADPPNAVAAMSYAALHNPFGKLVFQGLVTRPSVAYFLKSMSYADPNKVTEEVMEGFYQTAQEPNAWYAPICFVSGLLNYNVSTDFAHLTQPTMLIWGRNATTTPLKNADTFCKLNPQARLEVVDNCGMIAQDEQPAAVNALVRDFLA